MAFTAALILLPITSVNACVAYAGSLIQLFPTHIQSSFDFLSDLRRSSGWTQFTFAGTQFRVQSAFEAFVEGDCSFIVVYDTDRIFLGDFE